MVQECAILVQIFPPVREIWLRLVAFLVP